MNPLHGIKRLVDPRRSVGLGTAAAIAVATLVIDQLTKWLALAQLETGVPIIIIPDYFNIRLAFNTGAAFSILSDRTGLLTLLSITIALVMAVWAWRLPPYEQGMRPAMGLILGGAVGNLIDRVRLGAVVDFIQVHWQWKAFYPTFNIADSAICIGMALLVAASFHPAARAGGPARTGDAENPRT